MATRRHRHRPAGEARRQLRPIFTGPRSQSHARVRPVEKSPPSDPGRHQGYGKAGSWTARIARRGRQDIAVSASKADPRPVGSTSRRDKLFSVSAAWPSSGEAQPIRTTDLLELECITRAGGYRRGITGGTQGLLAAYHRGAITPDTAGTRSSRCGDPVLAAHPRERRGVTVSYFAWNQNIHQFRWSRGVNTERSQGGHLHERFRFD